jgi:hypothetical protein
MRYYCFVLCECQQKDFAFLREKAKKEKWCQADDAPVIQKGEWDMWDSLKLSIVLEFASYEDHSRIGSTSFLDKDLDIRNGLEAR